MVVAVTYDASSIGLAWQNTRLFWVLAFHTLVQHPLAIYLCAAITAAERAYVRLRRAHPVRHLELTALEFLALAARLLLVYFALNATLTSTEWTNALFGAHPVGTIQYVGQQVAWHINHHLRIILWEMVFFAVWATLTERVCTLLPAWLARLGVPWLRPEARQAALGSVLRNFFLVPYALICLIEIFRPAYQ